LGEAGGRGCWGGGNRGGGKLGKVWGLGGMGGRVVPQNTGIRKLRFPAFGEGLDSLDPVGMNDRAPVLIHHDRDGLLYRLALAHLDRPLDRLHRRQIADYGGVVNTMPKFAALFMLFTMANAGLPATSGFVGEFMVILGAVKFNFWVAFAAASSMIVGAAYSLWMYKRVIFGDIANEHVAELTDINKREFAILGILAICTLWMGLYPQPFTEVMHASVNDLLRHVAISKIQ